MVTPRPARSLAVGVALLASVTVTLTGCGDDSEQLCAAMDDLRASVGAVTDVQVEEGALDALKEDVAQVQDDFEVVRDEAADEFAEELDLVQKAAASAALAIDFAITDPSAETAADVAPALELLGTRLADLNDAVQGTC